MLGGRGGSFLDELRRGDTEVQSKQESRLRGIQHHFMDTYVL